MIVFVGLPALLIAMILLCRLIIVVDNVRKYKRVRRAMERFERNGGKVQW